MPFIVPILLTKTQYDGSFVPQKVCFAPCELASEFVANKTRLLKGCSPSEYSFWGAPPSSHFSPICSSPLLIQENNTWYALHRANGLAATQHLVLFGSCSVIHVCMYRLDDVPRDDDESNN